MIVAAIIAGFVLRLLFAVFTPVGGPTLPGRLSAYNDEWAHGQYAFCVLTTAQLPKNVESIQATGALARGSYENYQPPFYYLLVAGLGRLFAVDDVQTLIRLGRYFNVLLSGILAISVLLIATRVEASPISTGAMLTCLSLNGVFVRFGSTASNDVLFWIFIGGALWSLLGLEQHSKRAKHELLFLVFVVLGTYTKLTTILLLPLAVIPHVRSLKPASVARLLALMLATALLTLPVWLRNLCEFGGLLPLHAGFGPPSWRLPTVETITYAVRSFFFPWTEFWGGLLGLVFFLPAIALALRAIGLSSSRHLLRHHRILAGNLLVAMLAFLWLNVRYDQAEGRYGFAAWPALVTVLGGTISTVRLQWGFVVSLMLPYLLFIVGYLKS